MKLLQAEDHRDAQRERDRTIPKGVADDGEGGAGSRGAVQVNDHAPVPVAIEVLDQDVEDLALLVVLGAPTTLARTLHRLPGPGAIQVALLVALELTEGVQVAADGDEAAAEGDRVLLETLHQPLSGVVARGLVPVDPPDHDHRRPVAALIDGTDDPPICVGFGFCAGLARSHGIPVPRSVRWSRMIAQPVPRLQAPGASMIRGRRPRSGAVPEGPPAQSCVVG